ncbi:MAG: secondary thiamine-phosphate synthase enzyme YjbQ [bacterium]
MAVKTFEFEVSTKGFGDIIDVTEAVDGFVKESGLTQGIATVFIPGSTAGVTTVEYESGLLSDLKQAFDRWVPTNLTYAHDARWRDGNGFAHVRSSLVKTSITIPFTRSKLMVGNWQQIVVIDFDNRPRKRRVVVQVMGE